MTLSIEICCAEENLFGGVSEGYDVEASMRRYADLVTEAVSAEYPDADIQTTFQPQMWGVRVAATTTAGEIADELEREVEQQVSAISEQIHQGQGGDWAIELARA